LESLNKRRPTLGEAEMNGRDRILKTLNHEEPDQLPVDVGGLDVDTLMAGPYRKLCEYLKIEPYPEYMADIMEQTVIINDGSLYPIIPDLVEIGVDILNPIRYTAKDMDLITLKKEFGDDLSFWGAGMDTQTTLPFGTPEEVADEVKRNIDILAPGGGFVFASVHNITEGVPTENIISAYQTAAEYGKY
jgi:uroporphyrinogen-III decarboxylase